MFKTKISKIVALALLSIFLFFLGLYSINLFEDNKKQYYLKVQSKILQTKFNTSYKYFKIMSSDIFQMYSNNKKLINLFAKAKDANITTQAQIRSEMYSSIERNYKRLNKMGISQVHFHLPDNTSFLRMYSPSEFGDDLSLIRASVVKTNKSLTPQEGFEVCRFMSGIRFVYPMFDSKHQHIGSVEISYSSNKLLQSIEDDFIYDSHMLISKSMLTKVYPNIDLNENYIKSWEIPNYYLNNSLHHTLGEINLYKKLKSTLIDDKDFYEDIKKRMKKKKPFTLTTQYNYQNILLTYLAINATEGSGNISYIVTYTISDYLSNIQIEENYVKLLYFVILIFLTLFGIYAIYSQEKLKVLALYDNLTKLPNRTLFTIEFQNEINRASRYETNLALMFIDLDGFKAVNDTYGHQIGDILLQSIAQIITSKIRKSDIAARIGGDEFVVLLGDIKNSETAIEIAQGIIDEINKDIIIEKKIINIGASIGIAVFPDDAQNTETLMRYADEMMYVSKEKGKNQVTLYTKEETMNV